MVKQPVVINEPIPLDLEAIITQIEAEFAPRVPPEDPIRVQLRAFELLIRAALAQNLDIAKLGMQEAFDRNSTKKFKAFSDELVRYSQSAIRAIKMGRNEADRVIISGLVEMKMLVNELETLSRGNVWKQRVIGAAIALTLLGVGFVVGRVKL